VPLITNLVCAPTRSSDFVKTPQYLGSVYSIVPSSRKLWVCPLLGHPPASASSIAERHLRCSCHSYIRLVFSIPPTSFVRLPLFASFASTIPSSLYLRRTPMFVTALPLTSYKLLYHGFRIMSGLRSTPTVLVRCVGLYDNCLASLSVPLCSAALLAVLLQLL
jgi:hypothetical protein